MNKESLNFITFTNKGYIEYTHNLISSIKKNKVNEKIKIYALDNFSLDYFQNIHKEVELYEKNDFANNYLKQSDKDFGNLMLVKFELIYKELIRSDNVVYVDGDIVFKKNVSSYLFNYSPKSEIVFQDDLRPSKPDLINVCAGFMYIKSNQKTIDFFKPGKKLIRKFNKYKTHDQTYINKNKDKFEYSLLPLNSFPNGAHYYQYFNDIDPYIIHFNYVIGEKKKQLMKEHGEWYI